MSGPQTQHRPRRALALALAVVLVVALLGGSAWLFRDELAARLGRSADLKSAIRKFLLKESGLKEFVIPEEPAPSEVTAVTVTNSTAVTNNSGRVRAVKTTRLALPGSAWSTWFRSGHEQSTTYKDMYRLIGQQLALADRLLTNSHLQAQQTGLLMAGEASAYARTNTVNVWLGARICEAYLWPNLGLVETNKAGLFSTDAVLNLCDVAFKDAGETNHIIKNYELLIAKTTRPAQLDTTHYRLARIYMDIGANQKALEQFNQIKNKTQRMDRELAALQVLINASKTKP